MVDEKSGKSVNPNSGRSACQEYPTGRRRKSGGQELAPRSLRKRGRVLMSDCSPEELHKIDLF